MPRFPSCDGTVLEYRLCGRGEPLVCLPGGPARPAGYLADLGGLDQDRTLVLLDFRGVGGSDVPADPATYAFWRLADDVAALCRHLDLDRVDLLAHSSGSFVAHVQLAQNPDLVRRLVLVTPPGGLRREVDLAERDAVIALRAAEPWYPAAAAAVAEAEAARELGPIAFMQRFWPRMQQLFYGAWGERQQAHAALAMPAEAALRGFSPADLDGFDPDATETAASRFRGPVLGVGGDLDPRAGRAPLRALARRFPQAEIEVLPGCGHFPWVDEPAAFRTAVAGFLAR